MGEAFAWQFSEWEAYEEQRQASLDYSLNAEAAPTQSSRVL